jgi:hypothetical protein
MTEARLSANLVSTCLTLKIGVFFSILKNLALVGLVDPENWGLLSNCNQKLRTASVCSFMCFLSFDHLTSVREVCLFSFDGISWWWPARLLMCRIVEIL